MNAIAVTDSLSNRNEHVEELAKLVGKGRKRDLFALIYSSQKQNWTVAEIASALGIAPKNASTLAVALYAGGALHQERKGSRVSYRKVPAHKHIKDRVLKVSGDKRAIAAIPTKRRPELTGHLFVSTSPVQTRASIQRKLKAKPVVKVAFLMASPAGSGAINVGMDFREAEKAVQASSGRDKIELKAFPAADVNALLDALNEYEPDVMQFSGHGASDLLLLDGSELTSIGGMTLDFGVARDMLRATKTTPKCLVLTACQTAQGAAALLDTIKVIVAMSGNISDLAATLFCRRFYAAIAAKLSIGKSFEQAKASLKAEKLPDANFPTLLVQTGSSADELILVS